MKSSSGVAKIGFLSILLVSLFSVIGCEPTVDITIHNQTIETLQIFTGDSSIGKAQAGGEVVWKIEGIQPKYEIEAKDMGGNTVYAKTFTREELIRNKWLVVIPATAKGEQSDNVTEK